MIGMIARLGLLLTVLVAPKRWKPRVWHIAHSIRWGYAIENGNWATRLAHRLGFFWIDKDSHITKDGVRVFGHWGLITKNGFVLPRWFVKKYGSRPRIKDVLWADLAQLRTRRIWFRGVRRYRFVRMIDGFRAAHAVDTGVMVEQKGHPDYRKTETWEAVDADRKAAGMPHYRLAGATLSTMEGAGAMLRACHSAGVMTIVMPRGPIPLSWKPYIDFYKGAWTSWDFDR